VTGSYPTPGTSNGVDATDGLIFLAQSTGLRVLDASALSTPVAVGFVETLGDASDVAVDADHAFVVGRFDGLRVVDVSTPSSPVEVGSLEVGAACHDIELADGYAYLVAQYFGVVIDVTVPSSPVFSAWLFEGNDLVDDLEVDGNHAYAVSRREGMTVFDVTNPESPEQIGHFAMPGEPFDIELEGPLAYIAYPSRGSLGLPQGLQVLDISDPAEPVEIAFREIYSVEWEVANLAIAGEVAFIGTDQGLFVVQISTPSEPIVVGRYQPAGPVLDMAVLDGVLHVSESAAGTEHFDVTSCWNIVPKYPPPRLPGGRRVPGP
jgi:hypothetical protein